MWPTCLSSPGERIGLLPISFFFSFPLCSLLIEKTNQPGHVPSAPLQPGLAACALRWFPWRIPPASVLSVARQLGAEARADSAAWLGLAGKRRSDRPSSWCGRHPLPDRYVLSFLPSSSGAGTLPETEHSQRRRKLNK